MESNSEIPHKPVLLNEVVENFKTDEVGYFIDATLGYGGHSSAILENSPNLKLIGIDRDITAIEFSKKRLAKFGDRVQFFHGAFSAMVEEVIKKYSPIIGILADIGVSSLQLDELDRGFSFNSENLDMRMNQNQDLTAYKIINQYSEYDLDKIFKNYGEMRNSRKIAKLIVANRPISSGKELATLVSQHSFKGGGTHPATQLFQAVRIEVNNELGELEKLLNSFEKLTNCKVGIISFHSLEDRIVKNRFRDWAKSCICPPEAFRCECGDNHQLGKIITKRPIVATKIEEKENRRSRSAKLRIFQIGEKNDC